MVFACGYSGVRVAAFVVKVSVVTAEASQSEMAFFLRVVDEKTSVASSYENQLVCSVRWWINRCR